MSKTKNEKQNLLDAINPHDAVQILRILYAEDEKIAARIERVAHEYLSEVDVDAIAEDVYSELDNLQVEELWDRSGRSHEGHSEPGEMAYEMLGEIVELFLADMEKYQKLAKFKEANLYCMGILKGIDRYEKESKSKFKDWAGDGVGECWGDALRKWEKGSQNTEERKEMKEFVKKNFPDKRC